MANPRPIATRIPRPYDTEEDFIRGDGLAIGRLGMILIGAPKRPPGITIRFEIVLRNEEPVFRGEGRVVAHRIHANGREGLEIRFTRLDSRSKALVEQVLELRRTGALAPLSTTNPASGAPSQQQPQGKREHSAKPSPQVTSTAPADGGDKPQGSVSEAPPVFAPEPPTEPHEPVVAPEAVEQPPAVDTPAAEVLDSSELAPVEGESDAATEEEGERVTLESSALDAGVAAQPGQEPTPASVQDVEEIDAEPIEEIEEIEVVEEVVEEVEPEAELHETAARQVEPPPDEPLDEDLTPFAPPVMLDEEHVDEHEPTSEPGAAASSPRPQQVSTDVASVLSKLRERAAAFDEPESATTVLERLRNRVKAL